MWRHNKIPGPVILQFTPTGLGVHPLVVQVEFIGPVGE